MSINFSCLTGIIFQDFNMDYCLFNSEKSPAAVSRCSFVGVFVGKKPFCLSGGRGVGEIL